MSVSGRLHDPKKRFHRRAEMVSSGWPVASTYQNRGNEFHKCFGCNTHRNAAVLNVQHLQHSAIESNDACQPVVDMKNWLRLLIVASSMHNAEASYALPSR